jgi:hypothetical protein
MLMFLKQSTMRIRVGSVISGKFFAWLPKGLEILSLYLP